MERTLAKFDQQCGNRIFVHTIIFMVGYMALRNPNTFVLFAHRFTLSKRFELILVKKKKKKLYLYNDIVLYTVDILCMFYFF